MPLFPKIGTGSLITVSASAFPGVWFLEEEINISSKIGIKVKYV